MSNITHSTYKCIICKKKLDVIFIDSLPYPLDDSRDWAILDGKYVHHSCYCTYWYIKENIINILTYQHILKL